MKQVRPQDVNLQRMEKIISEPISFSPYLKTVIWGGNKICNYKGLPQTEDKIGESWEISDVPGHVSVVDSGEYAGLTLDQLIDRFGPQFLGEKVYKKYGGKFPLLIKFIDANDNLSVQVHPDDELAMKRHNSLGKAEMWYIIATDNNAKIYAGLSKQITPEIYEQKVADGSFTDVVATHDSAPGDVFFLPAGRVHAIGAGNLLAEIQESSDITYRIFDYNRRDANGNTRELHTELAKDAIDYEVGSDYKYPSPSFDVKDTEIVKCPYFAVRRILTEEESKLTFSPDSFTVLMCMEGEVTLGYPSGSMVLSAGNTLLLPAVLSSVEVSGAATLLSAQV